MIDQNLVKSGFDSEILFGSRYIQYLLLNAIETGSLQLDLDIPIETNNGNSTLRINIYIPEDYERLYSVNPLATIPERVHPDSFETEILIDHTSGADLQITVIADIHENLTGQGLDTTSINLFTSFRLNNDGSKIDIQLLTVEGFIIELAIARFGITREEIVSKMKSKFDRTIDLGIVGSNKSVQSIHMQKLPGNDTHQNAICMYLNLNLRDGPVEDSFLAERGDTAKALNFLTNDKDLAFGMPGSIYFKLANDAFQKLAEETSKNSGIFRYPLRNNLNDKSGEITGKFTSVSIFADSGNFIIKISGEYFIDTPVVDIVPDPSFDVYIYCIPIITNGVITWKFDYDFDIGPFHKFLSVFIGTVLVIFFGPGGLIAGSFLTLAVFGAQEFVAEPMILKRMEKDLDKRDNATLFDAIPNRLTIETRRWDPFYKIHHEIVAKTDSLQITDKGIGFSGVAILDKEPEPIYDVVIRTEKKDANLNVEELYYRVADVASSSNDFISNFPASDRMEFRLVENDDESNLVALAPLTCSVRIPLLKLLPMIPYTAWKVQIVKSQVDSILAISNMEINEQGSLLKKSFQRAKKDEIKSSQLNNITAEAIEELTNENGIAPTQQQIDKRVDEKLTILAQPALDDYIGTRFLYDLKEAINKIIHFDLSPELMGDLQVSKIMFLTRFALINRLGKFYYRDSRDHSLANNLMSLPSDTPDN